MLEAIKARIEKLSEALQASAGNHNALLGAKQELEALYKAAVEVAPVVEALDPELTPAINTVESVVNAIE